LRIELTSAADPVTDEERDSLMTTQELVEAWERETFEKGVERGVEKGLERGLEEGLSKGLARGVLELYTARFGAVPESVRRTVEATADQARLSAWLKLVALGSAEEIADQVGRGR
jgi:flagellar biosynthesis/type III secretory pathway protein FliH